MSAPRSSSTGSSTALAPRDPSSERQAAPPRRRAPRRHSVHRRTVAREHMLDVCASRLMHERVASRAPPRGPPWPIVFYVHGGGFRILSKDTHWVMGLAFARRGFVVFNMSYRLAPQAPLPGGDRGRVPRVRLGRSRTRRASAATRRGSCSPASPPARTSSRASRSRSPTSGPSRSRSSRSTRASSRARSSRRAACSRSATSRGSSAASRTCPGSSPTASPRSRAPTSAPAPGLDLDLADPVVPPRARRERRRGRFRRSSCRSGRRIRSCPTRGGLGAALRALGAEAIERYYPGELHAFHAFVMRERRGACWARHVRVPRSTRPARNAAVSP